jgi:hypothetical protein
MRLLAEKGFTEYCVFIRHYQSFFYAWKWQKSEDVTYP